MKLITFSGLDGSGKSTQLALLRNTLEKSGKRVALFHAVEFSIANRISRLINNEKSFTPGKMPGSTHASSFSILLRKIFLAIDALRFRLLFNTLRKQYDILLSDRYLIDTALQIEYLRGDSPPGKKQDSLRRLIRKPDIAFFLRINPEEILERSRVPEQGIEYLKKKFALFEEKKESWHLVEIDASKSEESIFQDILLILKSRGILEFM
ncbi:MAG: hypothetical protein IPL87_03010 [Candidatus Moraniibacteriota bacterium]|nr:MAG: hypothetical protein IPL87_03010 [Candidatus Moranbacteria bacterium]